MTEFDKKQIFCKTSGENDYVVFSKLPIKLYPHSNNNKNNYNYNFNIFTRILYYKLYLMVWRSYTDYLIFVFLLNSTVRH